MQLYYTPGACSLSPHIVAREAGVPVTLEKVDLKTHKTAKGEDYYAVNPKGYVPALKLDDGQTLTEGPAKAYQARRPEPPGPGPRVDARLLIRTRLTPVTVKNSQLPPPLPCQ